MRAIRPSAATVLLSTVLAYAAACSGPRERAAAADRSAPALGAAAAAPSPAPPTPAEPAALVQAADSAGSAAPTPAKPGGAAVADPAASTAATAMLIRTGTASVEVDSVEQAVERLRALAASLGGYVANASLAGGTAQVRSATLELKVPAARFDALTAGIRPLGRVESVDVKAEDVGEEYVDVAAQLENGRHLEARLVALAGRESNRLADLLAVERELARVRGEIDRAEGRMRYLRAHAATSTLAVTVHAPAPLAGGSPSTNPIAEAFREAWRLFVGVIAMLITALGVLVPLGVVAVAAEAVRRRARGGRGRAYGATVTATAGDHGPTPSPPNAPRTT